MMNFKLLLKRKKSLVLVFLLLAVVIFPSKRQFVEGNNILNKYLPLIEDEKINYIRMDSSLYQLWKVFQGFGNEEARDFAKQRAIDMKGELVRVVLEIDPERIDGVKHQVRALEGKLETSYKGLVQILIPVYSLQNLSKLSEIKHVRPPLKPLLCSITSEGVAVTGADYWQSIDSFHPEEDSVKVAILDSGFEGYEDLLGIELPDSVTVRSFRKDEDIHITRHGTACAEIVHDMAPEARLWLINYETEIEFYNAVDYLIGQGINIISYSMGWVNAGAGNGTGPICSQVKKADDNGIVWISAAGDEANNHWQGYFSDPDKDAWNNFYADDDTLQFNCNKGSLLQVFLNWNDWNDWNEAENKYSGSDQDYDLYLYKEIGESKLSLVAYSSNAQTGSQWPVESIEYDVSETGTYHLKIKDRNTSRNCKLELFIRNAYGLQYLKPEESLIIPADSAYSISVGATIWENDSYYSFSSQGPTSTGRIKPDYCAPAGVFTASYQELGFSGTSAAAPCLAGAFALLKAKTGYSLDEIEIMIQNRALDLGPSGKDNKFGWGRLRLVIH